jgi:hypothetical protein
VAAAEATRVAVESARKRRVADAKRRAELEKQKRDVIAAREATAVKRRQDALAAEKERITGR